MTRPTISGAPFEVLFVCTANMCRSPMAEHIFAAEAARLGGGASRWSLSSAGTRVHPGTEVHELVGRVLAERGLQVPPTPTRQVTEVEVESADLVLTAGREHRAWIVDRFPGVVRRTFTLRQFARQCAAGNGSERVEVGLRGQALLDVASAGRRRLQPVAEDDDLIADPVGGGIEEFRACAEQISAAVRQVLHLAEP